jgi:hypothetical protein
MRQKNNDLSKLLAPYKKGWVALNNEQTKVLAHADTFAEINDKIKDYDPNQVVLSAVSDFYSYFVGGSTWLLNG